MNARHFRWALWGLTALIWAALVRIAVAFVNSELDWRIVASYSRIDAPLRYRLAAVWGGLEGSLLLFIAVVALLAAIASPRLQRRRSIAYAIGTIVALAAIELVLANPFGRLDIPATGGFGLTPILEHPAMAVHPPLLYAGLGCAFVVFLCVLDGPASAANPRPWLRASLALITTAMALGAIWSYVEQGWGGYWAWDPVENSSLLVWLAVLASLHTRRRWQARSGAIVLCLPWILCLVGATVVRSGSTPSIHGFGQRAAMGWWLLALTCATAIVGVSAIRDRRLVNEPDSRADTAMNIRLTAIVAVVVLLGTLAPVIADLVADRPAAVRGRFYAAFVGPAALVALPFLALRLRHVWVRGWLAHLGMVVLIVGIAASTFDRAETVLVAAGQTVRAAGVPVTNIGVRVEDGPRLESDAVVATVIVDGHRVEPRRVAYRDRGGQLAENAVVTRPWRDLQVQLETATDAGAISVTVYSRPLMWFVWIGAILVAFGALVSPLPRRRRRSGAVNGRDVRAPGRARRAHAEVMGADCAHRVAHVAPMPG